MGESASFDARRGVLTALRAAAIIIIATGLNDVLGGALPRYEALYLYLGAIALAVLLDGVILGAFAAVLAILAYVILFKGDPILSSAQAAGVVVLAGLLRGFVRARRREPVMDIFDAHSPPLLSSPPQTFIDNTEVLTAIDTLREELRETLSRTHAEELTRRDSELANTREEAIRVARDAEFARETLVIAHQEEVRSLLQEISALEGALKERERIAGAHEEEVRVLLHEIRGLETSLAEKRKLDGVHQEEVGVLRKEISQLETALSKRENLVASREEEGVVLRREISELKTSLAEREKREGAHQDEVRSLRQEIGGLAASVADRAQVVNELILAGSTAQSEKRELLERISGLERRIAEESAVAQSRSDEQRRSLESAAAERARLESALTAARDDESSIAGRVTELELALSGARGELDAEHRRMEAAQSALADELEGMRRALEIERARAIALSGDVNDARAKNAQFTAELALERGRTAAERGIRERLELDATTGDDENIRLRARIDELEQGLVEGASNAEGQIETLRQELEAERERAEKAMAEGQQIQAEFDERLQTIVAHLAADHETDLGKAVEEREAARAEARSVTMKLGAIQRKVDEERAAITAKLREADEKNRHAMEDATRLLAETRSAAHAEIEALRLRLSGFENAGDPAGSTKPRVLLAHPDPDLRSNVRSLLERAGYDVMSAADGLEALRMATAHNPNVVIADTSMPKMDGRELCQLLKSQERTANIRVILLSHAGDEIRGEFPPDSLLCKPVPMETLTGTLAALLGTSA